MNVKHYSDSERKLMNKEEIRQRIINLRMCAGYTRKELAEKLDRDLSLIKLIETGRRNLSTEMTEKYADFFKVSKSYILFGYVSNEKVEAAIQKIEKILEPLSPTERQEVKMHVRI